MSTEQNKECRSAPVSIILKNNNSPLTQTACFLCGDTGPRAPVDFVLEGTNDHVCHACAKAADPMMAEVCITATESACHYYEHRERNAAVWRAGLILAKAKSYAVRDFHKYLDCERGMDLIPDDVREELAAAGLITLDDIAGAWRWPKRSNEEPLPF